MCIVPKPVGLDTRYELGGYSPVTLIPTNGERNPKFHWIKSYAEMEWDKRAGELA